MHDPDDLTLFLCGDVMTGRGIDQALPHPGDPRIYESFLHDARDYLNLAQRVNGPIPSPVPFDYLWGDALEELNKRNVGVRVINLETAVTAGTIPWPHKGINYKMHPRNTSCLSAARVDACALANNHVLDWGYEGLLDTLHALGAAGIGFAGAGANSDQAARPAVLSTPGGDTRVLLFSCGFSSSGIPPRWKATTTRPGVLLLDSPREPDEKSLSEWINPYRRPEDLVVMSIHWGGNWGYTIPKEERELAHLLIDRVGVDIVHGHSSHHPKAIEVYGGKPIFYGCGDFVNDYEGIGGYEQYRGDLTLMYFVSFDMRQGTLRAVEMAPLRMRRFRLSRASRRDTQWLATTLQRESARVGSSIELQQDHSMLLSWDR
jgi:poly-gamma-glutamate synthesis protein (capsule biosynthesis protein)